MIIAILLLVLCSTMNIVGAWTPPAIPPHRQLQHPSSSLEYTNTPADSEAGGQEKKIVIGVKRKPIIEDLASLDDLKYLLEEDDGDRITVIKFFAPWCKICQRLGRLYSRTATNYGDVIVARQKVKGRVHFAQMEYTPSNKDVFSDLRVIGLPTLRIYYGKQRLWESRGATKTKELEKELRDILAMSQDELETHANLKDDNILQNLLDEAMFDYSFLDEEW